MFPSRLAAHLYWQNAHTTETKTLFLLHKFRRCFTTIFDQTTRKRILFTCNDKISFKYLFKNTDQISL